MNVITSVTSTSTTIREYLTAARTYYVRTDGSDSNDGLTNTAAGAFLTIQYAVNVVSNTLDINSQTVTIQVADGAYNAQVSFSSYVGLGPVVLSGNTSTPTNVTISTTGASAFVVSGGKWTIQGFSLSTSGTTADALNCSGSCSVRFNAMDFTACGRNQISCSSGAIVRADGNYSISGGGVAHFFVAPVARFSMGNLTVTLTGTPNFSSAFATAFVGGAADMSSVTFSGAATGSRYTVTTNAVINTNGAGVNFFPGNAAGTTATGGQYA